MPRGGGGGWWLVAPIHDLQLKEMLRIQTRFAVCLKDASKVY